MVLDAAGRPHKRRIGFLGGMQLEQAPRTDKPLVEAIGSPAPDPEEDDDEKEETT